MKKFKYLTLFTVLVILVSAGIFSQSTTVGYGNSTKEINGSESASVTGTFAEKDLSSDDLKRCSSLNRVIARLDYMVAHPETFIRISGYDVYPG